MPDIAALSEDNSADAVETVQRSLATEANKDLLRFITCGSVDDGKSTLIGRFLYDAGLVYEDHLDALAEESRNRAVTEEGIDFSLLVDGLQAEREQGITIDVAYRFFATAKRKFIVADTPGHEQYTRNMATGASTADLAVVLIDARKGVLTQTRRHAFIASLLGIRHVAVVINKMDIIGFDEGAFREISEAFHVFAEQIGLKSVKMIPVSALKGDNITRRSDAMPWYQGPTLLDHLEEVDVERGSSKRGAFRLPVQWVNRPSLDFRGFSGTIASGHIRPGDTIMVARSNRKSRVREIHTFDGACDVAEAGKAVTLVLEDEIDISRGDVLCHPATSPDLTDQFQAHLLWMADNPMIPGRTYILNIGCDSVPASITDLRHRIDINSLERLAARELDLNELGVCNIATDRPVAIDPYSQNRKMGSFILIDRMTNATVAAGMIDYGLRRAQNIAWQYFDVDRKARALHKNQNPAIIWFTGLSGSGKSTIANLVEKKLHADGRHVYVLDGDNVRHGMNRDLGFTEHDRVENIRRVAEVARLLADAGLIVLVSFISPFRQERQMARDVADEITFLEIFVDAPLSVAEERDVKGLYARARAGQIINFTGIDSPYEAPEAPDLRLDTTSATPEALAEEVIKKLAARPKPI